MFKEIKTEKRNLAYNATKKKKKKKLHSSFSSNKCVCILCTYFLRLIPPLNQLDLLRSLKTKSGFRLE